MNDDEKNEEGGFKVSDRRLFTNDGELRSESAQGKGAPLQTETARESPRTQPSPERPPEDSPSAVDLSSLILSLATTTMVHLGDVKDPSGEAVQPDLEAAKQMVNILDMLQKKTEGNRTPEESRLLDDVLYELRMRILSKSQVIRL